MSLRLPILAIGGVLVATSGCADSPLPTTQCCEKSELVLTFNNGSELAATYREGPEPNVEVFFADDITIPYVLQSDGEVFRACGSYQLTLDSKVDPRSGALAFDDSLDGPKEIPFTVRANVEPPAVATLPVNWRLRYATGETAESRLVTIHDQTLFIEASQKPCEMMLGKVDEAGRLVVEPVPELIGLVAHEKESLIVFEDGWHAASITTVTHDLDGEHVKFGRLLAH